MEPLKIERRLRAAGVLVSLGLAIALFSMFWNHPLSFMVFLMVGMPMCALGILLYLWAIVSSPSRS